MKKSPHMKMRDVARVYDTLEVGLIITDGDGIVIWGNRYYSQLAKFDIRRYFGRNVREIAPKEDLLLPNQNYIINTVIETKQPQTALVRYRTQDYTLTTASPVLNEKGGIDYIIYSITNYSEMMRLQDKISQSAMRVLALENHLRNLQGNPSIGKDIIIANQEMYNIYGKALRLAPTSVSVMLTGESGTGKDVLARFIHQSSARKDETFIHVNMATIPKPLFESELFGYTPGSFTGAAKHGKEGIHQSSARKDETFIHVNMATIPKPLFESELFGYTPGSFTGAAKHGKEGLIQLAHKGTLFLDEIGELPLDIQAKLLQVIQNKEVRSIGAVEATPVDFRIICATNRDLRQMVENHQFRLDLYYRLNAIELTLPPLRNRPEDIPLLATFFLNRYNKQNNTNKYFTGDVIQLFYKYSWPGNVRELQHMIESLVVLCPTDAITPDQLPEEFHKFLKGLPIPGKADMEGMTLKQSVELLETHLIKEALKNCESAAQAAAKLGIDASTLSKKRKRYGL